MRGLISLLTDLDGNQYVDLASGTITQSLGHCHPEVVERLRLQAGRLWNVHDAATPDRGAVCDLLAELLPKHLEVFTFFSTGTEVIEAALRIVQAQAPPGRNRLAALRHGFHGKTQGSRGLVHWDIGHQSLSGNSVLGYSPYCYRCPFDLTYPSCNLMCARLVCRHIATKDNVAALVFEPVLGAAGVIVPPPGYWDLIATTCRENGVLLVADEGVGESDLVALSKGIASGFPVAVLAGRAQLMDDAVWETAGSFSSTYGGNPLGLAAARATIEVIQRDRLLERVRRLGALVDEYLAAMADRFSVLGDVRGIGLLHGLEFVVDRESRQASSEIAEEVYRQALDLGVRTCLGGNVIRLAPPFNIEEPLLVEALQRLSHAVELVSARRGAEKAVL